MSTLPAVRNNRIVEVNHEIYLQSAGPRVSVMLDELPKLLYPTVFN
jgi:ABC-type Fe3+-hydroxamate transport system substrate-binding protein